MKLFLTLAASASLVKPFWKKPSKPAHSIYLKLVEGECAMVLTLNDFLLHLKPGSTRAFRATRLLLVGCCCSPWHTGCQVTCFTLIEAGMAVSVPRDKPNPQGVPWSHPKCAPQVNCACVRKFVFPFQDRLCTTLAGRLPTYGHHLMFMVDFTYLSSSTCSLLKLCHSCWAAMLHGLFFFGPLLTWKRERNGLSTPSLCLSSVIWAFEPSHWDIGSGTETPQDTTLTLSFESLWKKLKNDPLYSYCLAPGNSARLWRFISKNFRRIISLTTTYSNHK